MSNQHSHRLFDEVVGDADAAMRRGDFARAEQLLVGATSHIDATADTWLRLAAVRRRQRDLAGACKAVECALRCDPRDFLALLMRANLEEQRDNPSAGELYGRAMAQAPDPTPPDLAVVVGRARGAYSAWQDSNAALLRSKVVAPSAKLNAMIDVAVRRAAPEREGPTHYCYPGLPEIPFYDRAGFPWLEALEAATDALTSEFEAVAAAEAAELVPYIQYPDSVPLDQWRALNRNRDWTAIHLIERGVVNGANAQHCPRTMNLLRSVPQPHIPGAGPNAMFSLLAPGTHIPAHTGIANTRLVCHLPLIVPTGCWFRVGDDRREWERGKAWVFDDTIEHEAMNPSDALRVILIVDCWHPDLSEGERADIAAVIAAGGQVHGL